jgi:hypothetical protein
MRPYTGYPSLSTITLHFTTLFPQWKISSEREPQAVVGVERALSTTAASTFELRSSSRSQLSQPGNAIAMQR